MTEILGLLVAAWRQAAASCRQCARDDPTSNGIFTGRGESYDNCAATLEGVLASVERAHTTDVIRAVTDVRSRFCTLEHMRCKQCRGGYLNHKLDCSFRDMDL